MKKNVEIVSLIYKSKDYLYSIYNQLKSDNCKVDGWEIGIRILLNDATEEIKNEIQKLDIKYTVFENPNPDEYYINRVYRAYNECVKTSEYDNVCLVNSDDIFSYHWLDNLLKHHNGINIPCSRLIESGKMSSGMWGVTQNFGRTPDTIDYNGWENYVRLNARNEIRPGGLYMPCVFEKQRVIESGYYPEGNIYQDGIGTRNGPVLMAGDDWYFRKLATQFGMRHITPFDSLVYHIIEGEKDVIISK